MPKWKKHNRFREIGPVMTPAEEVADYGRPAPDVTTMKAVGGKATDMKVAGQNTAQPGAGKLSGRNSLGRRVT